MTLFESGMEDARLDLLDGNIPPDITLQGIVAQMKSNIDAEDEYIAGYLSVVYSDL